MHVSKMLLAVLLLACCCRYNVASAQFVQIPDLNCTYECNAQVCHPYCRPLCQPPVCEAQCTSNPSSCGFTPVCDAQCPSLVGNTSWVTQSCPMCTTHCQPLPAQCLPGCQIVCEELQCDWQCVKPPVSECPLPVCELQCQPPVCSMAAPGLFVVGFTVVLPLLLCLLLM